MYYKSDSEKNFENLIIIGEVMAKSLVSCFFDSRCSFAAASQVFDVHVKNLDSSLQHNEN